MAVRRSAGSRAGHSGDVAARGVQDVPGLAGQLQPHGLPAVAVAEQDRGLSGPAPYRSPHCISPTSTGNRSRPFAVSRYSCLLRWPAFW